MKLVVAYILPDCLNRVIDGLSDHHVRRLTVTEVKGFSHDQDPTHPDLREYIGLERTRRLRAEIPCQDSEVEGILQAVYAAAHVGQRGVGRVLVLPVEDALRLRTGERGPAALPQEPNQPS